MPLGRDFWLFRFGQVVSVIGDACSNIALAWWILDKTGSAAKMSAVLAPAMFIQIILTPLAGPIGDRFSRKQLVAISELWRGVVTLAIASMVFLNYFNLPLLMGLYILLAVGTAIFNSVSNSIVPQLVRQEQLQKAMQQTQAISAAGGVVGGLAGGLIVTVLGVGGAFLLDASSFLVSAAAAWAIRANTLPARTSLRKESSAVRAWASELVSGIKMLARLRLILWFSLVAMGMNFVLSPIAVVLPVLVKQQRNLPPWFLGALESSISIGTVLGALVVGRICARIPTDRVIVIGLCMLGLGIGGMGWIPTVALPLVLMLVAGFGVSVAQVPLSTNMALAIPDAYRSRLGTIRQFLAMVAAPLGVALTGPMISRFGLISALMTIGIVMIVLAPALFAVPLFSTFFRSTPAELGTFLARHYPDAFADSEKQSVHAEETV